MQQMLQTAPNEKQQALSLPRIMLHLEGLVLLAATVIIYIHVSGNWLTHISMDRAVGYGMKYATDFKDTHMSHV